MFIDYCPPGSQTIVVKHNATIVAGKVLIAARRFDIDPNPFRPVLTPTDYNRKNNFGDAYFEPEP